jgi:hypothetical protein
MPQQGDITRLLAELPHGGRDALDRVYPLIYEELPRIAHGRLQSERADHTLVTSDLVHETYLKLAGLDRLKWENRAQFFAVAASYLLLGPTEWTARAVPAIFGVALVGAIALAKKRV